MTNPKMDQVVPMIRNGKTIVETCEELDLKWEDVAKYLHSIDMKAWLGAKRTMTIRLKKLRKEKDESVREQLVDEAKKWADYLYEDAKLMRSKLEKAGREMERAQKTLKG